MMKFMSHNDIETPDYIYLRSQGNRAGTLDDKYGAKYNNYFCIDFLTPDYSTSPSLDVGAPITFPSHGTHNTAYTGKSYFVKGITFRGSLLRMLPPIGRNAQYTIKLHLCRDRGDNLTNTSQNRQMASSELWEDQSPLMPGNPLQTTAFTIQTSAVQQGRLKRNFKFLKTWVLSRAPRMLDTEGTHQVWNGSAVVAGAVDTLATQSAHTVRHIKIYFPINKKCIDPISNNFTFQGHTFPSIMMGYMKYFWLLEVSNPYVVDPTTSPLPSHGYMLRLNARLHYADI